MTGPTRLRVISYTAALFVAGAVCGAMMLPRTSQNAAPMKLGCSEEIAAKLRAKLKTSLDLTPEQLAKLEPLIKKTSEEVEVSHRDCLVRISEALNKLHTQICADLTPEQKKKLDELEAERCRQMQEKYNYREAKDSTNKNK